MPLSTLCQRCGLCCDGNMFTAIPLRPAEVDGLRELSLPVRIGPAGAPSLAQRCTALEGRCCTVYAGRPEVCRRYRCLLLTALVEAEVSLEEALAVVEGAHARIAAVAAALPPSSPGAPQAVLQRARQEDLPEHGGPLSSRTRELLEQAEAYLDRHLRGRQRRGSSHV